MSKSIKSVKTIKASKVNADTTPAVKADTTAPIAPKAPAPIKYNHVVLNWQADNIGLTSGISKSKLALLAVMVASVYKVNPLTLIETVGLNTLKNAGIATDTKQVLIKDTDRQSISWVNEFKKCMDGVGNKKTMSCYINGINKMTAYDMQFFAKRVSAILKTTPVKLEQDIIKSLAVNKKTAKVA